MAPVLHVRNVHVRLGRTQLLEGAELAVGAGEHLCLVGRNGSGKSTLLRIAAGIVEADAGERFVQPGMTIRYLPQEPDLSGFRTTGAYVLAGLESGDSAQRAMRLLDQLGLTGREDPSHVSGGEARRAAIARVLAPSPDILLLDEPTNHLDLPTIEWLEDELVGIRSAVVLISHDRRFLARLSTATIWLDRGQTRRLEQGFAAFEAWRDALLEREEVDRHKLDRKIAAELNWLRRGVSARRKRNQGRLASLTALRQELGAQRHAGGNVELDVGVATPSGTLVIEARHARKCFGDKTVVRDISMRVLRGDRIGVVGANGTGKSTLVNLLTGQLAPDRGEIRLGANLAVAAIEQNRAKLFPEMRLADVLTGGKGDTVKVSGQIRHVMSYMKDFLFSPEQARTPVGVLSGGERARLLLARTLAIPSNLLLLDEPTNDLDLETLDLLQEMIADYPGTVLLVSHDRDFLDRTITSVLMAEGDGRFTEYAGGYSDMVAQRGAGVRPVERKERVTPAKTGGARTLAAAKRRLSYNEQHALQVLPDQIGNAEREIAELQKALADSGLYARDPVVFTALTEKLAALQKRLSTMEDRWIELEMLREEIAGRS
jgi:ABC transport system ATP-binding/permease protein